MNEWMNDLDIARLLALKAAQSSDWLFALPLSSCDLRMYDETIRVAVGLRLGLKLCAAHTCPCGALVSARGTHGLSCKWSARRSTRHHQISDLIWRAVKRAAVPASKQPSGLLRDDEKRPDGLTLVAWQNGRCLTWDATVMNSLASSYLSATSSLPGSAAEAAAVRERSKYAAITLTHVFVPVAVETLRHVNAEGLRFLDQIGDRLSAVIGYPRESSFLYQRLSVIFQSFNAAPSSSRRTPKLSHYRHWCYLSFSPSGSLLPRVKKLIIKIIYDVWRV